MSELSQMDMQKFFTALSERNEKALVPIPAEMIKSVKKVSENVFSAQLPSGDSLMLDGNKINSYSLTNPQGTISSSRIDVQAHYKGKPAVTNHGEGLTNYERQNAVEIVKAMKKDIETDQAIVDDFKVHYAGQSVAKNYGEGLTNYECQNAIEIVKAMKKDIETDQAIVDDFKTIFAEMN